MEIRYWLFQNTNSPNCGLFAYCHKCHSWRSASIENIVPVLMSRLCETRTTAKHAFTSQARLYSLQADPATYCNEPDGKPLWLLISPFCAMDFTVCVLCVQDLQSSLKTGCPLSEWKKWKGKSQNSWSTVPPYEPCTPKWYLVLIWQTPL